MPVGVYTPNSSIASGVSTVFPYSFRILDATHLLIKFDGVQQVSGFTISGVNSSNGGNVTFASPPAAGVKVTIERLVPYVRSTDYQANGDLREDTLDADQDTQTMQVQQIAEAQGRSLTFAVGSANTGVKLPDLVAGKFLQINSTADGFNLVDTVVPGTLVVTAFIQTLLDDADAPTARTTLGALSSAAGAVATANLAASSVTAAKLGNDTIYTGAKGRISLTTGVPVTGAPALSGATTVYFTPYRGNLTEYYDPVATAWKLTTFAEMSQLTTDATKSPAAMAASNNYDCFIWMDGATLRHTRGPTWAAGAGAGSATARGTGAGSTELELFQGRYVNKNAITNGPAARGGLYTGTIQSNAAGTIDDTAAVMGVWNYFNQVDRSLRTSFTGNQSRTSSVYGEVDTSIRAKVLMGLSDEPLRAWTQGSYQNGSASFKTAALAFDSTATPEPGFEVADSNANTGGMSTLGINNNKTGLLGSHFVTLICAGSAGAITFLAATSVGVGAATIINTCTKA